MVQEEHAVISSKSDYKYVDVSRIPVDGNIMPIREKSNGPRVLRAVDMAFLVEGFHERYNVYETGWWSHVENIDGDSAPQYPLPWPIDIQSPALPLLQAAKKVLNNIAYMLCAYCGGFVRGGGYVTYLNPGKVASVAEKMKLCNVRDGMRSEDIENELMHQTGLRDGFLPLNPIVGDIEYVKRIDLDRTRIRRAFADLKRLQYVIVPMGLDEDRSKVRMTTVKGYDSTPPEGESGEIYDDSYTRDIRLTVTPRVVVFGYYVSFPDLGCYCGCQTTPENTQTFTLYMSAKGNTDANGDDEEPGEKGVVCCMSEVNVSAEGDLVMKPTSGGWNPGAGDIKKTILVFRAWHSVSGTGGSGAGPSVTEETYWMRAYSPDGLTIKKEWIGKGACTEMLAGSGYRTTVDEHPDPAHTESCGVDLTAVFVIAKPQFRTDLSDVDCPTN